MGVIAAIKAKYKQRVAERALDLIDSGHCTNIYKIDSLLARTWVYDIWNEF